MPLLGKSALHVAFWRMTMSGINVFKMQGICKQVTNYATYLLPSLRTVLLPIQGHYGTPFGHISVMTSSIDSGNRPFKTGTWNHHRHNPIIMLSISYITFSTPL